MNLSLPESELYRMLGERDATIRALELHVEELRRQYRVALDQTPEPGGDGEA